MKKVIFYITLFLLILAVSMTASSFDNDLWARLIAGMGVLDGGHVLTQDFLSFTPVHTWWDHEWGAGLIFYAFLKFFGPYSLIILQAVLIFGIFFTLSKIVEIRYKEPHNILFYIVAIMTIMPFLNIPVRCHLFSFLFFTIFIYLLENIRQGKNKYLYFIPPIILFWNNIHGGVVSGIGLLIMYAIGEFLNKKPFKKYLITLAICCPILLINPWGFDYIKFLLSANTMQRPYIIEWWSIFSKYHFAQYLGYKIFMLIVLASQLFTVFKQIKSDGRNWFKNLDKTKYIIILTTLYLACKHLKLIPFLTISALCFMYEDFYENLKNIKMPEIKDRLIYGMTIFMILFIFLTRDFKAPIGFDRYPIKEVEFVKQNNLKGKLFSNFSYGSYIAYKLYPNNTIFMDGRYEEVYYDYMLPIQREIFLANPKWDVGLKKIAPDVLIIEKTYKIYEELKKSKPWKEVYEGKFFGVFVPVQNKRTKFTQPSDDENYYRNNLFDTEIKF